MRINLFNRRFYLGKNIGDYTKPGKHIMFRTWSDTSPVFTVYQDNYTDLLKYFWKVLKYKINTKYYSICL